MLKQKVICSTFLAFGQWTNEHANMENLKLCTSNTLQPTFTPSALTKDVQRTILMHIYFCLIIQSMWRWCICMCGSEIIHFQRLYSDNSFPRSYVHVANHLNWEFSLLVFVTSYLFWMTRFSWKTLNFSRFDGHYINHHYVQNIESISLKHYTITIDVDAFFLRKTYAHNHWP